jgi:hypothetical protein
MAKKGKKGPSPAEVARRQKQREATQQIRGNNSWQDCHELHGKCVDLLQQAGAIDLVLQQPGVFEAVTDKALLNDNIRLLAKDTADLNTKLALIYDMHRDKNGSCRTPDDYALSLQVYEQYIQFMDAYGRTCQPVLNHVMEQTAEAEAKILKIAAEIEREEIARAQALAQDPNSAEPIDVEVKDVPETARGMTSSVAHLDDAPLQPALGESEGMQVSVKVGETSERTLLHVNLDEDDANPAGTVEKAIHEHKAA